jgi:hypothetical protein
VQRRADIAAMFSNEAAIIRLIGAILLAANGECPSAILDPMRI